MHASLLPKYRGAAPITWAVVRGEAESGVTLMKMDAGMDTGAMLGDVAYPHRARRRRRRASCPSVCRSWARGRCVKGCPGWWRGATRRRAQDGSRATLAPMLKKEDGTIDFTKGARAVLDHVRGMSPWPGAFARMNGKVVKVHACADRRSDATDGAIARREVVLADKNRVVVACGSERREALDLVRVQLEGKKPVTAGEWVGGRGVKTRDLF